ncbi:MAG: hypothetical protein NC434_12360 [Ruminococcus sp.]|nr:hypothetical protein [Ruminococcus sp.]
MRDDLYKLEGKVIIPEDKKDEFNKNILQILETCGIRKTENIELDGQTITVIGRVTPDEQGIVRFDYSIFEKKKRETAEYNLNTCELKTPDRGYSEFGVVMNMIMVMQEAYSKEHCYFMYDDQPCNIGAYALLIKSVLGISLNFLNRAKMWDMLLFLKNTGKYENITPKMIWNTYSFDYCDFISEQFRAVLCIDSEKIEAPQEPFEGGKTEIHTAPKGKLSYYIYQNMKIFIENKEEKALEAFLKELLDMNLQKRQELAEDIRYGIIAEVSLYVLPPIIVHGYALAVQRSFWDVWEELGIKGYSDIFTEEKNEETENDEKDERYFPFYKAIQRDCEDEFVEFWKDDMLCFSNDMKECLADWKEYFKEINLGKDFDTESILGQIITELNQEWGCRLTDKEFVTEFMEHREDDNYKKALLLYWEIMNQDVRYFPELTRKQAIRWVLINNQDLFHLTAMSAFQSLLINHKHRYEILGF